MVQQACCRYGNRAVPFAGLQEFSCVVGLVPFVHPWRTGMRVSASNEKSLSSARDRLRGYLCGNSAAVTAPGLCLGAGSSGKPGRAPRLFLLGLQYSTTVPEKARLQPLGACDECQALGRVQAPVTSRFLSPAQAP